MQLRKRRTAAVLGLALLSISPPIHAGVPRYWDTNATVAGAQGGNGTWSNNSPSNWLTAEGTNIPWSNSAGDIAIFAHPASYTPGTQSVVTVSFTVTAQGLRFNSPYRLSGSTLQLNGPDPRVTVNANTHLGSFLTTPNGMIKDGPGTLTLDTPLSGPFTLAGGSAVLNDPLSGTAPVTLHPGTTLDLAINSTNRPISLHGGATLAASGGTGDTNVNGILNIPASGTVILQSTTIPNNLRTLNISDAPNELAGGGALPDNSAAATIQIKGNSPVSINQPTAVLANWLVSPGAQLKFNGPATALTRRPDGTDIASRIVALARGIVSFDDASSPLAARYDDPIVLRGGWFASEVITDSNMNVPLLIAEPGEARIGMNAGSLSSNGPVSALNIANLARATGGTVRFTRRVFIADPFNPNPFNFAPSNLNLRVNTINGAPAEMNDGILAGWALHDISATEAAFATLNSGNIIALPSASQASDINAAAATANVRLNASSTLAPGGAKIINSLQHNSPSATLNLNARILDIDTGGLIIRGGSITNGTLTSAANELFVHGGGFISATIGNYGSTPLSVVKSGFNATLDLTSANTFTGSIFINGGTLSGTSAALNRRPVRITDGTLRLNSSISTDFDLPVTAAGPGTIDITFTGNNAVTGLKSLTAEPHIVLGIVGNVGQVVQTTSLTAEGTITLPPGVALHVAGSSFAGAGEIRAGDITLTDNESISSLDRRGLHFAATPTAPVRIRLVPNDPANGDPVFGVRPGTRVVWDGALEARGAGSKPWLSIASGSTLVFGPNHTVNTVHPELLLASDLRVTGAGRPSTLELDPAFHADLGSQPNPTGGLASLNLNNTTLITHHSQSLPSIWRQHAFGGTNRYGRIAFDSGFSQWFVRTNSHEYSGQIKFGSSINLQVESELTYSGRVDTKFDASFRVDADAVSIPTINKLGPGTLNIKGDQGYAMVFGQKPAMRVEAGTVNFYTDPGAGWFNGNYTRDAGGDIITPPAYSPNLSVTLQGPQPQVNFGAPINGIGQLTIWPGGRARVADLPGGPTGPKVIIADRVHFPFLSATDSMALDLTNHSLIVRNSDLAILTSYIASARNAGSTPWSGPGITTSTATDATSLAILKNNRGDGSPIHTQFAGQPVTANDVLVTQTLYGDTNLDHRITIADYLAADRGFARNLSGWSNGDFDYSGTIDGADFFLIDQAFLSQASLAAPSGASVPEPCTASIFAAASVALLRRRRH